MWAKEMYLGRTRYMTFKQKSAFWARQAITTAAVVNMGDELGISLTNWIAPLSVIYAGPPVMQTAANAQDFLGKVRYDPQMAMYSGKKLIGDWGRFHLPGYGAYRDIKMGGRASRPEIAFFGMTMGRPELVKSNWYGHLMDQPQLNFDPREAEEMFKPGEGPGLTGQSARLADLIRSVNQEKDTVWAVQGEALEP